MLKKIATNSSNYTACALLKIGKTEYEILAKSNPSLNVFCKQVFDFLMLGLKTLKDKHLTILSTIPPKKQKPLTMSTSFPLKKEKHLTMATAFPPKEA
jgi:hypothetical protein